MKKFRFMPLVFLLAFSLLFIVTGCDDDDDDGGNGGNGNQEENVLMGDITEDMTLTPDNVYTIKGAAFVRDGATLTVEAGTRIEGEKETTGTLIIDRGAKLIAEGTADNPIIFTSDQDNPDRGDWGGVILNGYAPVNLSGGVGYGEGDTGEYGGDDSADDSGSLKYVRIEYAGKLFSPQNELNGLALQGVGHGTTLEHIQIHRGKDDGIEFYGGTVNAKWIYVSDAADDSFDWTFGWTGKGQFWLAQQSGDDADNGFESDNNENDHEATPRSNPTIYNITLLGDPSEGSESATGMKLRRGTAGTIRNAIVSGFATGLDVDDPESQALAEAGDLSVKNSIFYNNDMNFSDDEGDIDEGTWVMDQDEAHISEANPFLLDYTPLSNSPAIDGSMAVATPPADDFFSQVNYIGAVHPSDDWTAGWTTSGSTTPEDNVLAGDITSDMTLEADEYLLRGAVFVRDGATLTIPAGTTIKGERSTIGTLIIDRGARIVAEGTESNPIVFTSDQETPARGDWGGVILNGYAPVNLAGGVGYGEGDTGEYGGQDPLDDSGILKYVRVEWAGKLFTPQNELNGLALQGVGEGTMLDYIHIHGGKDDAIEFYGGTVNASHILVTDAADDSFDWTFGWTGKGQFWIAQQKFDDADNGFESDNNENDHEATPRSNPTIYNVTLLGDPAQDSESATGMKLRRGTAATIRNAIVANFATGIDIDDPESHVLAEAGDLSVKNVIVYGNDEDFSSDDDSFDEETWMTGQADAHVVMTDPMLDGYIPAANSPAINGSIPADVPPVDPFFVGVDFIGGVHPNIDWTANWTLGGSVITPEDNILEGDITSDMTLNSGEQYLLRGAVFVRDGATLTIPAGTVIKGERATIGTLIIDRGAQIMAEGTQANPIVFTSDQDDPARGDWGGVILNGYSLVNLPNGVGYGEGDTGEYGGTDPADNSGMLKYVRIEWAGKLFTPQNELNGLALQGVGSGTTLDYIHIHGGKDDAIEFYGGTVDAKHILVTDAADDSFDWTFGWTGRGQYWIAQQSGDDADNGFESDNNENDHEATPRSNPTIYNVTLLGDPSEISESATGMKLRRGTAATIRNAIVQGFHTGFDIDDPESHVLFGTDLTVKNVIAYNNDSDFSGDDDSFEEEDEMLAQTDAEIHIANPFLVGFMPRENSPAIDGTIPVATPVDDGFFETNNFIGGIHPDQDWTQGWTEVGSIPTPEEGILQGDITADLELPMGEYLIRGAVFVRDGATLTIAAGTTLKGERSTIGTLIIDRGAQIIAEGTAANPIVFTSDQENPARGDWGGVILNGYAPVNLSGGVGHGEGDTGEYGGDNPDDNSGILKYVRVEWAGKLFTPQNELNGLALQGVGSGTTLDYIQIHGGKDDAIEFYGGTVDAKHILATDTADDSFDWTFGWTGRGQYWIAQQKADDADNGFESDNNENDHEALPRSNPTIYNVTLLGDPADESESATGMKLRRGTAGTIHNAIISYFNTGIDIDDSESHALFGTDLTVRNIIVFNNDNNFSSDDDGFEEETEVMAQSDANVHVIDPVLAGFIPDAASPAVDGTVVVATPPDDGFFDTSVNVIGGIDPDDNWTTGWTMQPPAFTLR